MHIGGIHVVVVSHPAVRAGLVVDNHSHGDIKYLSSAVVDNSDELGRCVDLLIQQGTHSTGEQRRSRDVRIVDKI